MCVHGGTGAVVVGDLSRGLRLLIRHCCLKEKWSASYYMRTLVRNASVNPDLQARENQPNRRYQRVVRRCRGGKETVRYRKVKVDRPRYVTYPENFDGNDLEWPADVLQR